MSSESVAKGAGPVGGNPKAAKPSALRGAPKVVLDIYPAVDQNGVRTGAYAMQVIFPNNIIQLTDEFKATLRVVSEEGQPGTGAVTGKVKLRYGGAGPVPAGWEEMDGLDITSLSVNGVERGVLSMACLLAIADSKLKTKFISRTDPPE